jgi:hypothetical protein
MLPNVKKVFYWSRDRPGLVSDGGNSSYWFLTETTAAANDRNSFG